MLGSVSQFHLGRIKGELGRREWKRSWGAWCFKERERRRVREEAGPEVSGQGYDTRKGRFQVVPVREPPMLEADSLPCLR